VVVDGLHCLAADTACLVEDLLPHVVGAEATDSVDRPDEEWRAVGRERLRPLLEGLARLVHERLEGRRVRHLRLPGPLHDDRLEVLGAEHGAEAAAPRDALAVLPVVRHRREAQALLTRWADR